MASIDGVFVTNGICRVARSRNGLREIGFCDLFFENLLRFLQDIGPNASVKKIENGVYGFHFSMTLNIYCYVILYIYLHDYVDFPCVDF